MNHENYPEPDIPVDEGWAEMKKMLGNVPVEARPNLSGKFFSAKYFTYAALGLITMTLTTYYFLKDTPQKQPSAVIYYSTDKPQKVTLPDGTAAFLNKNSSIKELNSTTNERQTAVRGAAYFSEEQISSNQLKHHLILGSLDVVPMQANIYVSFDTVLAVSSVHVQSGSAVIGVYGKKLTLNAGESLMYDEKTGHISNKQKLDLNLFSYATKVFEFMDTPLKDAAESIENTYGVTIVFQNKKLYNCRITTRFDNKSLKEIFDIMAYTLNFNYQIDEKNNQVVLTGKGCE